MGPGKKGRLEKRERKAYGKYTDARSKTSNGSTFKELKNTGKLYDKLIKRQNKSIDADVDVQYGQYGGSTYSPGDSNNYTTSSKGNVAPGMQTTYDSIPEVNMYGGSVKSKKKK